MLRIKMQMSGCQLVETWQFQGKEVGVQIRGRSAWPRHEAVDAEARECAGGMAF
jgi:hypothetical protein